MSLNRYAVRVDPQGQAVTVDVLDTSGTSVAVYDSPLFAATQRTLPLVITAQTDFWLPVAGSYDVSCKVGGAEVADAGAPKRVELSDVPVLVVPDWERQRTASTSGGSTHVGVGDSFDLHYAEDRASTASNLVFDGQTPTIVGSTFSIDANNPGGVVVATGGVIAVTFMSTVQGATPGNEGAYVEAQVALYNGNGLVTQKQKPLASTETTIMTCVLVALVDDAESVLFTHYHEDTVDATLGVNVSVYIQKIA